MEILKKFIDNTNGDKDVARDVLTTEGELSHSDAERVVDVIAKYIDTVNTKLKKAMKSANPTEVARTDFTSEVVSLYEELVKDEPIEKAERKKSMRGFLLEIRNIFASFYGRVVKKKLIGLNDERLPMDIETTTDDHGLEEDALRALAVEVESMSLGKSVLEALESGRSEKDRNSIVDDFVQAALCSDYLSDEETRLKFALSIQLFGDEVKKKRSQFSTTSTLCLLAIAMAVKGCDVVSNMKYNTKMLQLKMCASEFLGDDGFMGAGKGE